MPAPLSRPLLATLAAACALCLGGGAAAADGGYVLSKTVPLGAPDRWDYVTYDPSSGRVFIAHGDKVAVVDGATGALEGSVEGMPGGTHGVAIDHRLGLGFTDDGRNGEAVAFDLKTLKVTGRVKVDPDADALAFDPVSGHLFVIEGDPKKIVVVDPRTLAVVTTIDAGDGLEFAAVDGRGHLFVNGTEKREVLDIDTRSGKILARWPVPDCASPHGLAIDTETRRIFTSCVNAKLFVLNADTGAIVADLPIGRGSDAVAFDATRKLVFSSDGAEGSVAVIKEKGADAFSVEQPVPTAVSGRTMAVDPASGRLFVVAADVAPNPAGGRPRPVVGTTRLLIFDPRT